MGEDGCGRGVAWRVQVGDHLLALWRPEEDDWREVTIIDKKKDGCPPPPLSH